MIGRQKGADDHKTLTQMQHTKISIRWDLLKSMVISLKNPAAPSMGWSKVA